MRKLTRIFLAFIIALGFCASYASAIVPQSELFYVNDAANILSAETEDYIFAQSRALDEATTAQIVVVTVPNLEGRDLEGYATELFRSYGIGDAKKNNGLLILLALEERQVRVEVGYGLEGALPDAKTGRLQDEYMIPYFKDDNFDEGMLNGYKAFFAEVAKEYNFDSNVAPTHVADNTKSEVDFSFISFILCILASSFGALFSKGSFKHKLMLFFVMELFVIPVAIHGISVGAKSWHELPMMLTIFNLVSAFLGVSLITGGGAGISGGHGHSGHSGGGGGFSGGGGRSGGGGSSRSF